MEREIGHQVETREKKGSRGQRRIRRRGGGGQRGAKRCKFMSNFVADAEATSERNFRTGILVRAGNKPSIGRTENNAERNASRNPYGRTVTLHPPCTVSIEKKRQLPEKEGRAREIGGESMCDGVDGGKGGGQVINTIGIEYRKAQREKFCRHKRSGAMLRRASTYLGRNWPNLKFDPSAERCFDDLCRDGIICDACTPAGKHSERTGLYNKGNA